MDKEPQAASREEAPAERREQPVPPIDFAELDQRRAQAIDEMLDDTAEMSHAEWLQLTARIVEKLKTELLAQADRFREIFITEQGSYYFVTVDGASLRLQMAAEGDSKIKPILMKQILVDDATVDQILASYDAPEKLLGQPLPKQPYAVGMRPLEIGIQGYPTVHYKESDEELIILGDDQGTNYSGMHLGHRITEIIK